MTSRALTFIFPKAEEGERAVRDGESEWQSELSFMDLWWGADTDRVCHRPQQFKSNLRHDRVSWILSCPITSSFFLIFFDNEPTARVSTETGRSSTIACQFPFMQHGMLIVTDR